MSRGWIYCLSNPAFPSLLKIGQTKNFPNIRSDQLYTTGVPQPFKIEFGEVISSFIKSLGLEIYFLSIILEFIFFPFDKL